PAGVARRAAPAAHPGKAARRPRSGKRAARAGGPPLASRDHLGMTAAGPEPHEDLNDAASTLPLRSGRDMPVIGFGTWQLTRDTACTVQAAIEHGYRMIDTSPATTAPSQASPPRCTGRPSPEG